MVCQMEEVIDKKNKNKKLLQPLLSIIELAKNKVEAVLMAKRMREKLNNESIVDVIPLSKYLFDMCSENRTKLTVVGCHSPVTQQFAKGFQACVARLHFAVDVRAIFDEDDDECWM